MFNCVTANSSFKKYRHMIRWKRVIDLHVKNRQSCFQLHQTKSHHINQLRIISKPAELACCAVSVDLPFWDAAIWEAFRRDHRDDETPPAQTANSLKLLWVTTVHSGGCNSRQEHYKWDRWCCHTPTSRPVGLPSGKKKHPCCSAASQPPLATS